eukprot:TRINITY_DN5041_c0_g1_i1.p1 TRINITY_DN5041_c0_g1~~TRINITY_DN5041_c0_g1_i1.p1  ORF type:complete len:377 (+),score=-4.42 TRINITY_DN5041_c0_g1_i1:271-1401(+)
MVSTKKQCLLILSVLTLPLSSKAGLMVPIVIINLSGADAVVDMSVGQSCVYNDFYPDMLERYYQSWQSSDLALDSYNIQALRTGNADGPTLLSFRQLDDYLQLYKRRFEIFNLRKGKLQSTGVHQLKALQLNTPPSFGVFEIEMDGSLSCKGKDSWKQFDITVNGSSTRYEIYDPANSNWEARVYEADNPNPFITDIGPGGRFDVNWKRVVLDVLVSASYVVAIAAAHATVQTAESYITFRIPGSIHEVRAILQNSVLPQLQVQFGGMIMASTGYYGFFDYVDTDPLTSARNGNSEIQGVTNNVTMLPFDFFYRSIPIENRNAFLGKQSSDIVTRFDGNGCYVAGTSYVIQADGTVVLVPLPAMEYFFDVVKAVYP